MTTLMRKLLSLTTLLYILQSISSHTQVNEDFHLEIDLSSEENRFSHFASHFLNAEKLEKEINVLRELQEKNFLSSKIDNLSNLENLELPTLENSCESRPDPSKANFYYFLPSFKAKVNTEGSSVNFLNGCFKNNKMTLEKLTLEETIITIEAEGKKSLICVDMYWITTSNIHSIKEIFFSGVHKITLKNLSQDDLDEIRLNGIKAMGFCQGFFTSLHSFFSSLKLYVGGIGNDPQSWIFNPKVPEYMVKANLQFMENYINYKPLSRGDYGKKVLDIDEKEIKTGDFIAIYRLDGLDQLIMLGTGSHLGHSAVACWIDGELYVLESQDGWYWPKRGIQRNKWKQWIEWAHNADFNVAILPLREEIRQKLDVEKALKWFTSGIEGLNYGYHNFVFSWLDTPHDNFPKKLVQTELTLSIFSVLEKVTKEVANIIIGEGLNLRLGSKGLSIPQVTAEAARRNMSFEELYSLPEQENWQYSDGANYVCSCFVVGFWKAAGLFDGIDILPNEFTPKDIYNLNFFDLDYKESRPEICKQADPNLPYCQIMGKYQIELNGYSTISPYSHMNEKCPSVAPDFFRTDNC